MMAANIKGGNSAVVQRQQNPGAALGASIMESIKQLSEFVKSLNKNRKSNSDLIRLYGIVFKQALIILTRCMDDKYYNTSTISCCLDLINDAFEKLDNKDSIDFDQVLWMINDRCVMIADKKTINVILMEKIVKYNTRFISFMLTDIVRRKDRKK
ncbi:unnamed protein product [Gongylonema pulchrum]|uniref:Uncharacterized protein n=1 Tax=Gongylonema pulchrum TaxID=637853 RepID=A0A3P6SCQ7_9BILA|nr:unnamed protein product [Gongylonema pulchrum]